MQAISLGKVAVPVSGTPVALASSYTACNRIRLSVVAGGTGKCYLGTSALNKATMAGVLKEFWPNSAGGVDDSYEFNSSDGTNSLNLADYRIDASVSGEGLIVGYWVN